MTRQKFNPWAKFEHQLHPARKGEDTNGIADRRINPEAFRNPNWKGPEPKHFKARLLPEIWVLVFLRESFRETDPEKFKKCQEAIWNFKTQAVNWDDFV